VVQVPSGVAVIANGFWPAKLGRDKLEIIWDDGPNASLSTAGMREQYANLAKTPGTIARKVGDSAKALAGAAKQISAEYEVPYLAHAMMEPLNCVVDLREDHCEIWTGTQFQTGDRNAAAAVAGLKPEQVQIHTTLLGGGFGRRANPDSDFVKEAVHVAKAAKVPVKVIWTRGTTFVAAGIARCGMTASSPVLTQRGTRSRGRTRLSVNPSSKGRCLRVSASRMVLTFDRRRGGPALRNTQCTGRFAHPEDRCTCSVVAFRRPLAQRLFC
jgi:CO/xanthine dehydrogenase Mo-binding subunit